MKVILYTRVSTDSQADCGVSLESQKQKLEAYAALYDLEVVEVVEDAGESGKTLNRPGLQHALSMLSKGAADGIAVLKLDRLCRSISDWQTLIHDYFGEKAGKELFSVSDNVNTKSATGRMVLNMILTISQWEREIISERTTESLQHKIRNRQRVGQIRYGFNLGADGKALIPNQVEQEALALMRQLRDTGATLREIAAELSNRSILTKQGLATWSAATVGYILKQDRVAA